MSTLGVGNLNSSLIGYSDGFPWRHSTATLDLAINGVLLFPHLSVGEVL